MSQMLLDCEPICGMPWQLSLADQPWEREDVFRLRHEVFHGEQGHVAGSAEEGRDADQWDDWCDHLMLRDEARGELIGTYRLISGPGALRNGGFYSGTEFDLSPMAGIAPNVLEVGRTCVAPAYRNGLAMQFLWYGLELVLQRDRYGYLLGCASFDVTDPAHLNTIWSYTRKFNADPEFVCNPRPQCVVPGLKLVETDNAAEKLLPPLIRGYLKLGAFICSPPAWDPDFHSHDLLVLFRRDKTSEYCTSFLARMERQMRLAGRRAGRKSAVQVS